MLDNSINKHQDIFSNFIRYKQIASINSLQIESTIAYVKLHQNRNGYYLYCSIVYYTGQHNTAFHLPSRILHIYIKELKQVY